jgi:group I intron endonuclease
VKTGIYKIINIQNNKFYIGSAVNFSRRKTRHFSELRTGKHKNKHLQAAWNKYGESFFIFTPVEEVKDKSLLLEAENNWLKKHVGKAYCYNIGVDATAPMLGMSGELSPTWKRKRTQKELAAQNWEGKTHSEESKEKIRQYLIGKPKSIQTRAKISATLSGEGNYWYGKKRPDHGAKVSKGVAVTNPSGFTVHFDSISALRRGFDFTATAVNRALKSGKPISRGPRKGYVIKYSDALLHA